MIKHKRFIAGKLCKISRRGDCAELTISVPVSETSRIKTGTDAEVTVEVEEKKYKPKKLIRPEGAKWVTVAQPSSSIRIFTSLNLNNGEGIACASGGDFLIDGNQWESGYGRLELAQLAAEHHLADRAVFGFGWGTEEETEEETEEDWAAC